MGLGGFGGAGPEGPPNVTEGAGQAPPPTGCLRPYSYHTTTYYRHLGTAGAVRCGAVRSEAVERFRRSSRRALARRPKHH